MQHKEVRVDLRIARKNSGLLQSDVAGLLGITQPRVSRLEQGRSVLTVKEACTLLVVYNATFSELFGDLSEAVLDDLSANITQFSGAIDESGKHPERRQSFLDGLCERLAVLNNQSAYEG